MTQACIVGWSHSQFAKTDNRGTDEMIRDVTRAALSHAGVDATDVDEIVVGTLNAGFTYQDFPSSLPLQADPSLRFKPSTRVENACATGSAAVYAGIRAIDSHAASVVLVVGYEKMSEVSTAEAGRVLLKCSYAAEERDIPGGFAGVFGQIAGRYFDAFGDQSDALAMIAAKNHRNGTKNPYAQMRKDLGFEFCNQVSEKNPIVAGLLRRTDCSPVSDGAVALVLMPETLARANNVGRAVRFRAHQHVNDFLPMSRRDMTRLQGAEIAWDKALRSARLNIWDLSLVETHDCFTIAELMEYEAMGMAKPGKGNLIIQEGVTESTGRLPVNVSGGLKAKGHPIGATGVSMHVLAAMQLAEAAGEMQVANPRLAGVFNMGGTGVANYVSVLERAL